MTEDEMAGWHHRLDGLESERTPGVGDGQGGLACCDSWGHKESDTTERLNITELILSNPQTRLNSLRAGAMLPSFQHVPGHEPEVTLSKHFLRCM